MKVDKAIPMPKPWRKGKYPFREMEIGDSFAVTNEDRQRVAMAASLFSLRNKKEFKFSVCKFEGAYRCWRVPLEEPSSSAS